MSGKPSSNSPGWAVTFEIYRQKGRGPGHYDRFPMEVDPDEYVLDGIERIWAFCDRSVTFCHACHHSTCGACGMRVNGVEKLTCITPIRDVTVNGGTLKIEPLRNFDIVSDLVVDMGSLYSRMEMVSQRTVVPVTEEGLFAEPDRVVAEDGEEYTRLCDCLECGMCVSACSIPGTNANYLGPAVLAAVQQNGLDRYPDLLRLVDSGRGVWRCHSAFECSEVCPSFVDPGRRIMDLRKQVVRERFKRIFRRPGRS